MNEITDKIFETLKQRKIKITDFAKDMDMSRDTIYKLKDDTIKLATIKKIANYLDLNFSDFINVDDKKKWKKQKKSKSVNNTETRKSQMRLESKIKLLKKNADLLKKNAIALENELKKEFKKLKG